MREHQIVISLKPEQFQEVQKQARAAGAQSVGAFVRQNLLHFLGLEEADSPKKASQIAPAVLADPDWKFIAGELRRLHHELKVLASEATVSNTLLTDIAGSSGSGPQLAASLTLGEAYSEPSADYMQPAAQENFLTDGAPISPDDFPEDLEESLILPPAQGMGGTSSMPFQFQSPSMPSRSPYGLPMPSGQIPLSSPFSHHTFMPSIAPLPGDRGIAPGYSPTTESSLGQPQSTPGADANSSLAEPGDQTVSENTPATPGKTVEEILKAPVSELAVNLPEVPETVEVSDAASSDISAAAQAPSLPQVAPTVSTPVPTPVQTQAPTNFSETSTSADQQPSAPAPAAPQDPQIAAQSRGQEPAQPSGADQPGAFAPQKDDMEVLADRAFAISPRLGAIEPEVTMQPAAARSFADTLEELLDAGLINQVLSQADEDPSDQIAGEVEAPPEDDSVQVFIQEVEVPSSDDATDSESLDATDKVDAAEMNDSEDEIPEAVHHEPPPPPRPIGAEEESDKDQPPKPPPRRKKLM